MKVFVLAALLASCACADALRAADADDYLRDVQPILARHCVECHGPDEQNSELRLDTARGALAGGNSCAAIVPVKSGESLLIDAITEAVNASKMPPEGERLSSADVSILRSWIDQGAKAPKGENAATFSRAKSDHWSYQPIDRKRSPPKVDEPFVGVGTFVSQE